MTDRIEAQVERFAPGFRDRILARATHSPAQIEAHDPNYVGGDINAGISDIRQLLFRPTAAPRSVPRWPGAVPVLVIDAARRRGPRHERLSRRAVGACGGTCGERLVAVLAADLAPEPPAEP